MNEVLRQLSRMSVYTAAPVDGHKYELGTEAGGVTYAVAVLLLCCRRTPAGRVEDLTPV